MMEIQLSIVNGNMDDAVILKNIIETYGMKNQLVQRDIGEKEMGGDFLPSVILLLPEITQFIRIILPAIQTYFETKKPSGTKQSIELIHGDKKITIIHEDGKPIDEDNILKSCKDMNFFE